MKVVSNTSPLILLFETNYEYILNELFGQIIIPSQVYNEIIYPNKNDRVSQELKNCNWIDIKNIELQHEIMNWDLGIGETSTLSFAFQNKEYTALLDDGLGRKCANILNIDTIGTGGILIQAKREGIIKEVKTPLELIRKAGLWISDSIFELLLRKAGE